MAREKNGRCGVIHQMRGEESVYRSGVSFFPIPVLHLLFSQSILFFYLGSVYVSSVLE